VIGLYDGAVDGAGNVTGGADFTTRFGDAPSSVGEALGAAIFAVGTGNDGTDVTGTGLSAVEAGGGTWPVALAGETTPRTNTIETKPASAILRGNEDNRDSSRGLEAVNAHSNQTQLALWASRKYRNRADLACPPNGGHVGHRILFRGRSIRRQYLSTFATKSKKRMEIGSPEPKVRCFSLYPDVTLGAPKPTKPDSESLLPKRAHFCTFTQKRLPATGSVIADFMAAVGRCPASSRLTAETMFIEVI
jgi:hypothetical protein